LSEGVLIALIMSGLGVFGSGINGYFIYRANKAKKAGSNPHPCKEHEGRLDLIEKDVVIIKNDVEHIKGEVTRIRDKQNGVR